VTRIGSSSWRTLLTLPSATLRTRPSWTVPWISAPQDLSLFVVVSLLDTRREELFDGSQYVTDKARRTHAPCCGSAHADNEFRDTTVHDELTYLSLQSESSLDSIVRHAAVCLLHELVTRNEESNGSFVSRMIRWTEESPQTVSAKATGSSNVQSMKGHSTM